ncbi:MAG: saccharopine dehydrogenase family protein, partial [Acidobacteriota bacterium]
MSGGDRKRIAVFGCGLVGSVLAQDLAAGDEFIVTAFDGSEAALDRLPAMNNLVRRQADLSDRSTVVSLLDGMDLAAGAVPGFLGATLMAAALEARCALADISFTPEDATDLDTAARERGVSIVVDCGVAPGLSNLLAGREAAALTEVTCVEVFVGGLPVQRDWPYEYRFLFSPTDVIEEYTRPCHMRENGMERVVPALSGLEMMEFPGVGTLEAFYTDGLRTLLRTITASTLREKTLRFPGHAEKMRLLRDTGFFDTTSVELAHGTRVSPRQVSEHLLGRLLKREPGHDEMTLLRVIVEGNAGTVRRRTVWDLIDQTDPETGWTSMARTTAFPCAQVARLLADGTWDRPGICAPETLG